jgi:hypothetical protein
LTADGTLIPAGKFTPPPGNGTQTENRETMVAETRLGPCIKSLY